MSLFRRPVRTRHPQREAAEWHGALVGKSLPGGTVTAAAWTALTDELIERLAALPRLDGLWYDIHGRPPRHLPVQAVPSFNRPAATGRWWWSFTTTRTTSASRRALR